MEEVSNYGANTGAKACGDEWLTKRQGNCVHKRLADTEHTNWDGLGQVLLDALVLGLEKDCKTSTNLAAACHHQQRKQVVDALSWALWVVKHNVDWGKCLVKTNRNQWQEGRTKQVSTKDAKLVIEVLKDKEDCLSEPCTCRLKNQDRANNTENNGAKWSQEGVKNAWHNLVQVLLQECEEDCADDCTNHAACCCVEQVRGSDDKCALLESNSWEAEWKVNQTSCNAVNSLGSKKRHTSVSNGECTSHSTKNARTAKLLGSVLASENWQVSEKCPTHGPDSCEPPLVSISLTSGEVDNVDDTVDQTCRNDARKQWNKDVSNLLEEALNRLVLVLSLLSCLVVLSCRDNVVLRCVTSSNASKLGELNNNLVDNARTKNNLKVLCILDQTHDTVDSLDGLGVNLCRICGLNAEPGHADHVALNIFFATDGSKNLF